MNKLKLVWLGMMLAIAYSARAATVLVEAESFADHGGWKLDTQFIEIMGSPYLLAHGLGVAVDEATTTVEIPEAGTYKIWARTKDWVAPWGAAGAPGKFNLAINGKPVDHTFGTTGAEWHWEAGGSVQLPAGKVTLALQDLTGFDGRCDAIVLSSDPGYVPDNTSEILPKWRRALLGVDVEPIEKKYDLVVVGGGYAGICAAISGARMGAKVALIQNRGVLGGNGSAEVRVWAMGNTPSGLYPVGDIVQEITDRARLSPGRYEEFGDEKKERIVRAEENIDLFLHHHAFDVEGTEEHIEAVHALDVKTSEIRRFAGKSFADCTGHGYIAMKAGAHSVMIPEGRMGMSNMWRWEETSEPQAFPETPWALDLEEADFPYPRKHHAQWFWESGYDKHPLNDLELIRDWNFRASYGAWNAIKNKGAYNRSKETKSAHKNARMTWLAYIGGTRETQQFLGDVVLTEEDIVNGRKFDDAAVLTTWSIDLHYPKEQYLKKFPDNPFISKAVHGRGVDRKVGYGVPYRCFYSRNIDNLFLAGRNVSVTHEALGTVRVMKTGGMMGVVVGKAAAICAKEDCTPRDVYEKHLDELKTLMNAPGTARRKTVFDALVIPEGTVRASSDTGYLVKSIEGIVIDNHRAELKGDWVYSTHTSGYVERDYAHDGNKNKGKCSITYPLKVKKTGLYEIRFSYRPGGSRASSIPVVIVHGAGETKLKIDESKSPGLQYGFISLGEYLLKQDGEGSVTISNEGTDGFVVADAVQLLPL